MTVEFIGQGYNAANGTSVARKLMSAFADESFNHFSCLVAFASRAGVAALTPHIINSKNHIESFRVVVGIDQKGTSREALSELINWEVDAFIYFTTQRIIFHPKIYIFTGEQNNLIVVGSNNMTTTGLVQNIESSLAIEFSNEDAQGQRLLADIRAYYGPIFNGEDRNLRPLTNALIERLVRARRVPNEVQRRAQFAKDAVVNNADADLDISDLFTNIVIQPLPAGFVVPRNIGAPARQQQAVNVVAEEVAAEVSWQFRENDTVLVAELSGPTRWAQANFNVRSFVDFFGATPGDNNYFITLRYVAENGAVGEEIQSQAVTVASSNYRFELRAATGVAYPRLARPIAVFIRIRPQAFFYTLIMPDIRNFAEVRDFLNDRWGNAGDARSIRRISTTVATVRAACPDLPFWVINA